jgi:hypothetical protein
LKFFRNERFKDARKRVLCAVPLIASCFINERDNAGVRQTSHQNVSAIRDRQLNLSQRFTIARFKAIISYRVGKRDSEPPRNFFTTCGNA